MALNVFIGVNPFKNIHLKTFTAFLPKLTTWVIFGSLLSSNAIFYKNI